MTAAALSGRLLSRCRNMCAALPYDTTTYVPCGNGAPIRIAFVKLWPSHAK